MQILPTPPPRDSELVLRFGDDGFLPSRGMAARERMERKMGKAADLFLRRDMPGFRAAVAAFGRRFDRFHQSFADRNLVSVWGFAGLSALFSTRSMRSFAADSKSARQTLANAGQKVCEKARDVAFCRVSPLKIALLVEPFFCSVVNQGIAKIVLYSTHQSLLA